MQGNMQSKLTSEVNKEEKIVITLRKDGSTNLDKRMITKISDMMTAKYGKAAFGILNKGQWIKIKEIAPVAPTKPRVRSGQTPSKPKSDNTDGEGGGGTAGRGKKVKEQLEAIAEIVDEEAMALYDTQLIVYHEELKIYVKFCSEYQENKVKMYADLHDFLSQEAAEKLEQTEGFETEIEQPRDGEKLWDCIRDVLVVGTSEPSPEIME